MAALLTLDGWDRELSLLVPRPSAMHQEQPAMKTPAVRRIAAATAGGLISLSLALPASAADHTTSSSSTQTSPSSHSSRAHSPSVKKVRRALARAEKAAAASRRGLVAAEAELAAARESAAAAGATFQAAQAQLQSATTAHAGAKEAVERAQYLINTQGTALDEANRRIVAAENTYGTLLRAWQSKRDALEYKRFERGELASQVDTTTHEFNVANENIARLTSVSIPTATRELDVARSTEQRVWTEKENTRNQFDTKKQELRPCRQNLQQWECNGTGKWKPAPGLDRLDAELTRLQREYNQRKDAREGLEQYMGRLTADLARNTDNANRLAGELGALNAQLSAKDGEIAQGQAAADAAKTASDSAYQAVLAARADADKLQQDTAEAKKNLPALVVALQAAAVALTQADAGVTQVTPAHLSAQEAVVAADGKRVLAKTGLNASKSLVRTLKKKLKKLTHHR